MGTQTRGYILGHYNTDMLFDGNAWAAEMRGLAEAIVDKQREGRGVLGNKAAIGSRDVFYWVRPGVIRKANSSTGDKKGAQCPGVQLGHFVAGGYKFGDLALQVGGVSNETVKYGSDF
jgi:hypothetical protein